MVRNAALQATKPVALCFARGTLPRKVSCWPATEREEPLSPEPRFLKSLHNWVPPLHQAASAAPRSLIASVLTALRIAATGACTLSSTDSPVRWEPHSYLTLSVHHSCKRRAQPHPGLIRPLSKGWKMESGAPTDQEDKHDSQRSQ